MLDYLNKGYHAFPEPSGPCIVFINGEKCFRRFHFGGWITFRVEEVPEFYNKETEMTNPTNIRKIEEGYRIYHDQFVGLKGTLKEWINMMRKYCDEVEWVDVPYYFYERTNVGLLSSAIWKAGGYSLEEFGSTKKKKSTGTPFVGRVDLEFYIKDEPYYVEFKQFWPNITKGITNVSTKLTQDSYANAKDALKEAKTPDVKGLIGLFAIPIITEGRNEDPTKEIRDYLNWLVNTKTPDVLAWWFPEEVRYERHPGVLLFLRRAIKK